MPYARKETSTNHLNQLALAQTCVLTATLERLSARWKIHLLFAIREGQRRFSLLRHAYPAIAEPVLGRRLRELEGEGLVVRTPDASVVPTQIQYFITPKGEALLAIMAALCDWEQQFTPPTPPRGA